jgi:hypothetical protein
MIAACAGGIESARRQPTVKTGAGGLLAEVRVPTHPSVMCASHARRHAAGGRGFKFPGRDGRRGRSPSRRVRVRPALRGLPGPAEPPGPLAPSESPLVILRQVAPQLELGPLVPGRRCPARGLGVGGAMADGRRPGLAAREPGTSAEEQARWFTSRRSSSHWRLF